jgi:hypothetical protein
LTKIEDSSPLGGGLKSGARRENILTGFTGLTGYILTTKYTKYGSEEILKLFWVINSKDIS